jgi:hypothetical protein
MEKGKAEELKLIKDNAHLWMNMINRVKAKSRRDLWIQAYEINGTLRMSSPKPKDFDEVKEYLVKMGIVEPEASNEIKSNDQILFF